MPNVLRAVGLSAPVRLAAASPAIVLCDPMRNADAVIRAILHAEEQKVDYLALPELCLTGATAGTLLRHPLILQESRAALHKICDATARCGVTAGIGLPYLINGRVMSCTALVRGARIYAILPAVSPENPYGFLPETDHCLHRRQPLTPVPRLTVAFGNELFEPEADVREGHIQLMPSSLNATAASFHEMKAALAQRSARTGMAIAYAAAGTGESSGSFVFDGVCAIAARGELLACSEPLAEEPFVYADVRPDQLTAFEPYAAAQPDPGRYISADPALASEELSRLLDLQAAALCRRLTHIHGRGFVVGVSGGLDSALALLASAAAADRLKLPRTSVVGVSMPGFGTSGRTKNNAELLVRALGCEYREISVVPACRQHFADIGHAESDHSIVFENAQARERTQILLSIANAEGLLDVGTGDLSEAALGWTTFGGDHLAQYGINASIPKTVVRRAVAEAKSRFPAAADVLQDILDTPVSPELLPAENGEIAQKTEELVGSYELHDFFLWHLLRGKSPRALFELAREQLDFPPKEIHRVLGIFLKRFFSQQYKRSCAPEAPKLLVSIAPSALPLPSDLSAAPFLREYEALSIDEK